MHLPIPSHPANHATRYAARGLHRESLRRLVIFIIETPFRCLQNDPQPRYTVHFIDTKAISFSYTINKGSAPDQEVRQRA
ncbi:hypothetical protein LXA47_17565 [Massilia sp. P8910]|nr:hypothetical protein [Massilia antarctica]